MQKRLMALVALTSLLVVACGGGSGSGSSVAPPITGLTTGTTTSPTTSPRPTTSPTTSPTAAPAFFDVYASAPVIGTDHGANVQALLGFTATGTGAPSSSYNVAVYGTYGTGSSPPRPVQVGLSSMQGYHLFFDTHGRLAEVLDDVSQKYALIYYQGNTGSITYFCNPNGSAVGTVTTIQSDPDVNVLVPTQQCPSTLGISSTRRVVVLDDNGSFDPLSPTQGQNLLNGLGGSLIFGGQVAGVICLATLDPAFCALGAVLALTGTYIKNQQSSQSSNAIPPDDPVPPTCNGLQSKQRHLPAGTRRPKDANSCLLNPTSPPVPEEDVTPYPVPTLSGSPTSAPTQPPQSS